MANAAASTSSPACARANAAHAVDGHRAPPASPAVEPAGFGHDEARPACRARAGRPAAGCSRTCRPPRRGSPRGDCPWDRVPCPNTSMTTTRRPASSRPGGRRWPPRRGDGRPAAPGDVQTTTPDRAPRLEHVARPAARQTAPHAASSSRRLFRQPASRASKRRTSAAPGTGRAITPATAPPTTSRHAASVAASRGRIAESCRSVSSRPPCRDGALVPASPHRGAGCAAVQTVILVARERHEVAARAPARPARARDAG